jgi:hypothetical protein
MINIFSTNIIKTILSRWMKWVKDEDVENAYKILVRTFKGKGPPDETLSQMQG